MFSLSETVPLSSPRPKWTIQTNFDTFSETTVARETNYKSFTNNFIILTPFGQSNPSMLIDFGPSFFSQVLQKIRFRNWRFISVWTETYESIYFNYDDLYIKYTLIMLVLIDIFICLFVLMLSLAKLDICANKWIKFI